MTDSPSPTGAGYLAELAALGGYFGLDVDTAGQGRCLPEFFTDAVIGDQVRRTRAAVAASVGCGPADIPIRMAASSFQLGVAARLLSPVIGAALCLGAVPVLDMRSLRWIPADGHAPRFAVAGPTWTPADTTISAQLISASVVAVLTELGTRLHTLVALSPRVTLGNLSSAANGAVTVLAMSRPGLEASGRALVRALLDIEPLAGTGDFVDGRFRRNSCCLYYQAPKAGLCGDCVLVEGRAT